VDFILRQPNLRAVEVRSKGELGEEDLRTLRRLAGRGIEGVVIYPSETKTVGGVRLLNLLDFLYWGLT